MQLYNTLFAIRTKNIPVYDKQTCIQGLQRKAATVFTQKDSKFKVQVFPIYSLAAKA